MKFSFIRYCCIVLALCISSLPATLLADNHIITVSAVGCSTEERQSVPDSAVVALFAEPSEGFFFIKWSDGNIDNPRVVSVASDVTYQAVFGTIEDITATTYTLTVSTDGCSSPLVKRVPDGATCELLAVPDATCGVFTQWSDGNTDNPRSVVVTSDTTYTAEFTREQYTITTTADNAAHGTVSATTEE